MKKFVFKMMFALAVLVTAPFMLTGCGEEEEIPYELTVKSVVVVNDTKQDFVLTNHQALKAITEDGQYIGGNGYDLTAPIEPKYKFLGWYKDDGSLIGLPHNISKWTMFDRDGYIEARYEALEYEINLYVGATSATETMYTIKYNCITEKITSDNELPAFLQNYAGGNTIPHPEVEEGYNFVSWQMPDESTEPATLKDCSAFPLQEDEFDSDRTLNISARYEAKDCHVSFEFRNENGDLVDGLTFNECINSYEAFYKSSYIPMDTAENYKYDESVVSFIVDFAEIATKECKFLGIYVDGRKVSDSNVLIYYPIMKDTTFVINVKQNFAVSFEFVDNSGDPITTLTLEDCGATITVFNYTGDIVSLADTHKYGTTMDISLDLNEIDTAGYTLLGIFVGDEEIDDIGATLEDHTGIPTGERENYQLEDDTVFVIKLAPKQA